MKKHKMNGFTLIELLAVVAILGVIMLISIVSVTRYISNSKKDAYVQLARAYIQQARNELLANKYRIYRHYELGASYYEMFDNTTCQLPTEGHFIEIPISVIDMDKEKRVSPYGNSLEPYAFDDRIYYKKGLNTEQLNATGIYSDRIERGAVYVFNDEGDYLYFVQMVDSKWKGFFNAVQEEELDRKYFKELTNDEISDEDGPIWSWEYTHFANKRQTTINGKIYGRDMGTYQVRTFVGVEGKTYNGSFFAECY